MHILKDLEDHFNLSNLSGEYDENEKTYIIVGRFRNGSHFNTKITKALMERFKNCYALEIQFLFADIEYKYLEKILKSNK